MRKIFDLKRLLIATVVILIAVAIGLALRPRPVAVDVAAAERGAILVTLDEEGETRVRDRFVVSAPVAGRVLRIELEPGDAVIAGETVVASFRPGDPALLDTRSRTELEAAVRSARAALGSAEAERSSAAATLEFARAELERYRALAEQEVVARSAYEMARRDERVATEQLAAATNAVERSRRELEVARARLLQGTAPAAGAGDGDGAAGAIVLRAPVDGVVLRRLRESEAVVPAGEPLLELGDPARLEIVADYLSADAVQIRAGMPVLIEQWGGGTSLGGRVRRVEPAGFTKVSALGVEEQRVNVLIDVEAPHDVWETLGDGYRVEVRVVVYRADDVLKVPTGSLFRAGDGWAVFAIEDGHAALREVELGERNGLEAEIRAGLDPGTEVVVHPGDQVADGVEIERRGG